MMRVGERQSIAPVSKRFVQKASDRGTWRTISSRSSLRSSLQTELQTDAGTGSAYWRRSTKQS